MAASLLLRQGRPGTLKVKRGQTGGLELAERRKTVKGGAKAAALTVTSNRPGMPLTPLPGSGAGPGVGFGNLARGDQEPGLRATRVPATLATVPSGPRFLHL